MSAQPDRMTASGAPRRDAAGRSRTTRTARVLGVAVAAAVLTAGCAAGQLAQTATEKSVIDGSNASVGRIDLRSVAIQAPPSLQRYYRAGTAAALKVVLVNNGRDADRLTSVRTSAAASWSYFTDYNDAFQVQEAAGAAVTGTPSSSASPTESPTESATASATGSRGDTSSDASSDSSSSATDSASPSNTESGSGSGSGSGSKSRSGSASASDTSATPSASATSLPSGTQSVTLPTGARVSFGTPDATGALLLTDVSRALYPGSTVRISFTFEKAGTITVAVPVQLADSARTAVAPGGGESEPG